MNIIADRTLFALGTVLRLKAYGAKAEQAIAQAVIRINEIDNRMSAFKEYSDLSRINQNAGKAFVQVCPDTYEVIKKAVCYSERFGGAYDPTIKPLVDLWGVGTNRQAVPNECSIQKARQLVNYQDIFLDEQNQAVMLRKVGQSIDLGGIAKGYAADEVRDIFLQCGIRSGLIDLGGNVFALGVKTDGNHWRVGIQDPDKPRGAFIGILSVTNKSIVTSGGYEKYFVENGQHLHHIIDPLTGQPSKSDLISATIISENSIDGDGFSTGVFILGLTKAIELIEGTSAVEAVFLTKDKQIFITSGIGAEFCLTSEEYQCSA